MSIPRVDGLSTDPREMGCYKGTTKMWVLPKIVNILTDIA